MVRAWGCNGIKSRRAFLDIGVDRFLAICTGGGLAEAGAGFWLSFLSAPVAGWDLRFGGFWVGGLQRVRVWCAACRCGEDSAEWREESAGCAGSRGGDVSVEVRGLSASAVRGL